MYGSLDQGARYNEFCKEWAKELGFRVWTTTITVFLMGQAYQIELVLGTIQRAFTGASSVLGILPSPFVSLYSPFIVIFSPPDWGPQGRYLSHPPLRPVVGNGCKDREVWLCQAQGTEYNKGCLPLYAFVPSVVFLHFRAFPALWNGLEFRH